MSGEYGFDLRQVVYALSDALDLVGVDDVAHGKRVGIMAASCAHVLGWDAQQRSLMFDLGMLHDLGVSSTQTHLHLLQEFDWAGSQEHAELGAQLLAEFAPLAHLALPVRYHHTRWEHLCQQVPAQLTQQQALQANLIYLVDRVDTFAAPHYGNHLFDEVANIQARVQSVAGSYFSPQLVDAFVEASRAEAFWLMLEPRAIQSYLQDQLGRGGSVRVGMSELRVLASIFSRIVDAKSEFTATHSLGVSRLARFLAERMGVSQDHCDKIEVAGLLHDLGKLRVPDEVLNKPGKLDVHERQIMNAHSFETYQILRKIDGFEEIALWAAYHHEEPGGSGYPFHVPEENLSLEARILRVADIFQAMAQDRPYRPGLTAPEIQVFLQDLAGKGKLDANVVATAMAHLPAALKAATPASPHTR
jgi:putative nucleotidyltransferase with HDIG domain